MLDNRIAAYCLTSAFCLTMERQGGASAQAARRASKRACGLPSVPWAAGLAVDWVHGRRRAHMERAV